MKVKLKAPIFNAAGLFKKGDLLDVEEKDFDASIMEAAPEPEPGKNSGMIETTKKAPAKTTAGRKKKEA